MILPAKVNDYARLIEIWENSVRATHDFITEEDIKTFKPLILNEYFKNVNLFCSKNEKQLINGFMGIDGDKLEMLFVDSGERGKGIGKKLINYAITQLNVRTVDVNEQNRQAVGFYKHLGFKVISRSEVDSTGKNYPILSMVLKS